MTEIVAIVPVRAGSKGLAGKNFRLLGGAPLWSRAVGQGLRVANRVIVTTDATEILRAEPADRVTHLARPADLARDDSPMAPVVEHALGEVGDDATVLLLQPTSPLRRDEDIAAALARHGEGGWSMVLSVTPADRGVLKWGRVEDGCFRPLGDAGDTFANRQSLPPVHRPDGAIYVFTAAEFRAAGGFPPGRIGVVETPRERALDIDDAEDFARAEAYLARQF